MLILSKWIILFSLGIMIVKQIKPPYFTIKAISRKITRNSAHIWLPHNRSFDQRKNACQFFSLRDHARGKQVESRTADLLFLRKIEKPQWNGTQDQNWFCKFTGNISSYNGMLILDGNVGNANWNTFKNSSYRITTAKECLICHNKSFKTRQVANSYHTVLSISSIYKCVESVTRLENPERCILLFSAKNAMETFVSTTRTWLHFCALKQRRLKSAFGSVSTKNWLTAHGKKVSSAQFMHLPREQTNQGRIFNAHKI